MSWKLLGLVMTVVMILSLGSFCIAQEKVKITWWYEQTTPENLQAMEKNIAKPYEEANPNIDIEICG